MAYVIFGEAMEYRTTHLSLVESAGIQKVMKETGKQLVMTSSGEAIEAALCMFKGAFSPWQLLQIPVELLTKFLINRLGFKSYTPEEREAFAYGLSKVASLSTAACVGLVAGPFGVLGAIAFWFAAEVVSYSVRKVILSYF
jgi:hypothetical protein